MSVSTKKLPKSLVEIEGEIPAEDFERHYQEALKELNEKSSIPGFRSGHIPENILMEKISEVAVLEHAAEHALQENYPKIVKDNKIDAIGQPQITITKIARHNPLGFKIITAILPEIKLPDYKKIASDIMRQEDEIRTEEKEIDEAVEFLRKSAKKDEKGELPRANDEWAKNFSQPDLNSLKNLLKNNILQDKKIKTQEKKRMETLEKISISTIIEIPDILIQSEKEKMISELRSSIENMGMKWEDYLKHIKKTEEELKNSWLKEAEKRARYALILHEIANTEKIEPLAEELNDFAEKAAAQYPESERQKIDKIRLKDYAYGILRNEKVFQLFESQKQ